MMICVVASLLVIIFSFSFWIIISALILNCILYLVLIRITRTSQLFQVSVKFPEIISNRRNSNFNYEQD
jgi:Flp pilus assembly protein TadB